MRARHGPGARREWERTADKASEEGGEEGEEAAVGIGASALGVAQPLNRRNTDASIESCWSKWEPLTHIIQHNIAFYLILDSDIEHVLRDINTDPLVSSLCDTLATQSASTANVQDKVRGTIFRKSKQLESSLR